MNSTSHKPRSAGSSFQLGGAFGIPIRVHWSFLGVIALVWFTSGLSLEMLIFLIAVFAAVLVHEFGHGLMAKRHGLKVPEIIFWSMGGKTHIEMVEDSRVEMQVALAGPGVNLILASLCALTGLAPFLIGQEGAVTPGGFIHTPLGAFALVNLTLGIFNLLPAFPMDGGRILRAWFARDGDWLSATERAVKIGRYVSLGGLLLSVALGYGTRFLCILPVLALYLQLAGARELMEMRTRKTGSPFSPGGFQFSVFGRQPGGAGQAGPGPMFEARDAEWEEDDAPHTQIDVESSRDGGSSGGGFSEADIERMEKFRGPLDNLDD